MPTIFEITTAQNHIRLDAARAGAASYTVANVSGRGVRGRLNILADTPDALPWLSIVGDTERNFAVGADDQVSVKIAAPATAKPGTYTFHIGAVDTERPDDTLTEGPTVSFDVIAPVVQPNKPINPLLIIIPIIVVIVIIVILVIALSPKGLTDAQRTQTATATELTATAAEQTAELTAAAALTRTQAAINTANANATGTQAAIDHATATRSAEIGTQTAVAANVALITQQAGATQTQLAFMNTFTGSWVPSPANNTLNHVTITLNGTAFTVTYNSCQPPVAVLECISPAGNFTTTNVTLSGSTLTATDGSNVLSMTRQGDALSVRFRGTTYFFVSEFRIIIGPIIQPIEILPFIGQIVGATATPTP